MPEILDLQAGLGERLRNTNPLDIDGAERAIRLACLNDAKCG